MVYTDHPPLIHIFTPLSMNAQIICWVLALEEFNVTIVYKPRKYIHAKDAVSHILSAFDDLHAQYDCTIHNILYKWLEIIAPDLTFDKCTTTAKDSLTYNRTLSTLKYTYCSFLHLNFYNLPSKKHIIHTCLFYIITFKISLVGQGNPLEIWGPTKHGKEIILERLRNGTTLTLIALEPALYILQSIVLEPLFKFCLLTA